MVNRRAWFPGVVILAVLAMLGAQGLADDTCLVDFSGPDQGWSSLTAPVVPSAQTTSTNRVYLGLYRPEDGPFWQGDVVRFALSSGNEIVDKNGDPALGSDGSVQADAVPYWSAKDWADPLKPNYMPNDERKIYTYLGDSRDLTISTNQFRSDNALLTKAVLGNPVHAPSDVINYVRGADVFDENHNGDTSENREVILGDVLHSRPLAFTYRYADGSSKTVVFFGANDGMLHALLDSETNSDGDETLSGKELWAFIPPDQLHRLKNLLEGLDHSSFIDASPRVYVRDVNGDGVLDAGAGDRVILVCGERGGGTSYFALDITDPDQPYFLWRICQTSDAAALSLPSGAGPDTVIAALGRTWSEPTFGLVRTSDDDETGTPVFFVGGGYTSDNSSGKAVLAIQVFDGRLLRIWHNGSGGISGMDYAVPSAVTAVDEDDNGFVDKLYVGDTGGQLWRIGRFTDADGNPLSFPGTDENVMDWMGRVLFIAGISGEPLALRKFFYPPSVTLEKGYDLVFIGSGDVTDPCSPTTQDRVYAVKDLHDSDTLTELDLVDVTTFPPVPDLDDPSADVDSNGHADRGWYARLSTGEKVLAKGLVFNGVYYFTTFAPKASGGEATLYALDYKTGEPALSGAIFPHNPGGRLGIGISIPSEPVAVVTRTGQKILVSKTLPTPIAERPSRGAREAGILAINPAFPSVNFFYLWWMQR